MTTERGSPREADERSGRRSGSRSRGTPLAEWMVAAVSCLLVLAMLGYLVADAVRRPERPAVLQVRSDSMVQPAPGVYLLMTTVSNEGGKTAARVLVRAELLAGGATVEESETTVDYVPVGAEREAILQFTRDPRAHESRVRVLGFTPP